MRGKSERAIVQPYQKAAAGSKKRGKVRRKPGQRKPDQSSATRMESVGLEGSYLMLAG
jgi:hypothetical protein